MNIGVGRDWTLYALIAGRVKFDRLDRSRKRVSIEPHAAIAEAVAS